MTKKIYSLFVSVLVLVAMVAGGALAVDQMSAQPKKVVDPYTGKIVDYNVKRLAPAPIAWGDDNLLKREANAQENSTPRYPLGSAAAPANVSSPGNQIYETFMDDQYRSPGKRMVDFRGKRPDIHFVYSRTKVASEDSRFGYNMYNPILGTWPQGPQSGCVIQQVGEAGQHAVMDVNGRSRVVIGGADGAPIENHFYWQPLTGAPANCSFGAGGAIAQSQYDDFFVSPKISNNLAEPAIEIQEWAGDTMIHVLGKEEFVTSADDGTAVDAAPEFGTYTLNYFRKIGNTSGGTWTGPICIDTVNNISNGNGAHNGSITASRMSPDVAVAYVHWKVGSPVTGTSRRYDNDVWYRISTTTGLTWGPKTNLTNYSRLTASFSSFLAVQALYDHQGFLHIVWDGGATVPDVYNNSDYFWGDFSTNIFHWSNRTNETAKAHNAQWGIDLNTQVCGFGSPGTGYAGFYTMSECENRIYIVFSQYLNYLGDDVTPTTPQNYNATTGDCASGGFDDRVHAANGELYMVVSKDLDGILWDAARNITKTYTPKCDSVGFGGVCMNDTRSSLSRYGMDADTYDTAGVPITLIWPGTDLIDLTPLTAPPDTGNNFIMMLYTEDHFPAPGYRDRDPDAGYTFGRLTLNPLRFVRLACADPVNAPRIFTDTTRIGYPAFTHHNVAKTVTVTVTNEGNATLNISQIKGVKTTQGGNNWLTVTNGAGMTVPAGIFNTGTFDITLNAALINIPGTIVDLSGSVYIKSDAKAPRDSINIVIDRFLVADTVAAQKWDTISTVCGVRLIVSNNGEMGRNGLGGSGKMNMDYWRSGTDCDTAGVSRVGIYLYDGGPIVNREITPGAVYSWSNQLFQLGYDTDESFKPALTTGAGSFATAAYDGYATGTFVNRDTTIGIRATYYAPITGGDSCNFIVVKRQYFNMKASPVTSVTIGEQIDWDIPADSVAYNSSKILGAKTVYQRGIDTGVTPDCGTQRDSSRYGASYMLGKYTKAEYAALPNGICANDKNVHSVFSETQDTLYKYDSLSSNGEGKYFWNRMVNGTGLAAATGHKDMRTVYTYYANRNFAVNDTVTVYTALVTIKNGTSTDLDKSLDNAFKWYNNNLRPTCNLGSCCLAMSGDGRTGNVDEQLGSGVDISDVSALISFLYIPPYVSPVCMELANCDGDWSPGWGIDISDISAMISNLYIPPYAALGLCQ
jgi:hypothetical protein